MPSWNIHTAHVERLLDGRDPADVGIADANAFLFGNFVPDVYLGFMVEGTTYRIDYLLTHLANPNIIPVPDADRFWDECVWHRIRRPSDPACLSLTVGAWAHLLADRMYNARFRRFCETHEVPRGDELRKRKQADFKRFGWELRASRHVEVTPQLLDAARQFRPYSVLPDDVVRSVRVADAIVDAADEPEDAYRLLSADWMRGTFDACDERLRIWLSTWAQLAGEGRPFAAIDIRAAAGLPPATPDDPAWEVRPRD